MKALLLLVVLVLKVKENFIILRGNLFYSQQYHAQPSNNTIIIIIPLIVSLAFKSGTTFQWPVARFVSVFLSSQKNGTSWTFL